MTEFRMPSLGSDMEAGTLVEWLKKPGDALTRGDIIAVVDTEKGAIEIEVFENGVLDRILVTPGNKVPVGTPLAMIRGSSEPASAAPATVAAKEPPMAPPPAADRGAAMRAAIGAAMARSKREIPHVYLSTTVDMTSALTWLATENERRPVEKRLLPVVLLIKAVARAIVDVPQINGFWTDDGFRPGPGVHVGCAIALRDGGLVAPAIHDADAKSLEAVMEALSDLVERARRGSLRSSELADPTITVTNLGDLGVEATFAVIFPPQVAIVGFGRVVRRPWVVGERIEPRSVLTVTVSADHRALDGRRAGQFLSAVDRWLQVPERL